MKKILPKKTLQIISVCFSILLFLTNESFEQNAPVKYKATTTYPDLTLDDNFKYAQDTKQKVFLFYKDYATSKGNENGNIISIASGLAHTGNNNVQLKTQNIKSGMYIIKLSTENGSGEFKVIKE